MKLHAALARAGGPRRTHFTMPAGFPRADVGYESVPLDLRKPRRIDPDPADVKRAARGYGLDVIVIVCDDGGLEMAPLAEALGGDGVTVRGVADLERAAEAIANRTRPLLIDLRLEGTPQ